MTKATTPTGAILFGVVGTKRTISVEGSPGVPDIGETVMIDGDEYRVTSRHWSYVTDPRQPYATAFVLIKPALGSTT